MKHFPYTPAHKINDKVVHRGKWLPNREKIHILIKAEKPA